MARDLDVLRAKARAQDSAALAEEEELTKTHWTNQHVNQATSPLGLADYWADLERVQPGAAAIAWEQVFSNCDPFASSFLPNDPTLGTCHDASPHRGEYFYLSIHLNSNSLGGASRVLTS